MAGWACASVPSILRAFRAAMPCPDLVGATYIDMVLRILMSNVRVNSSLTLASSFNSKDFELEIAQWRPGGTTAKELEDG